MEGVKVEGVMCEGVKVEGVMCEGVIVEGMSVEGVRVEGVMCEGVREGVRGEGVREEGVRGEDADLGGACLASEDAGKREGMVRGEEEVVRGEEGTSRVGADGILNFHKAAASEVGEEEEERWGERTLAVEEGGVMGEGVRGDGVRGESAEGVGRVDTRMLRGRD